MITVGRAFCSSRQFGRVVHSTALTGARRGFHATTVDLGRKGSSAFIDKPRDFSKKQKKRFKKKMMLRDEQEKRNNTQGKMTSDLISQQLGSPETQDLIENTGDSMLKDIREMMLPDGLQALLEDFDDDMFNIDKASPDNELEAGGMPHFSEIGLKLAGEDSTGNITQSEMIAASGLGMDLVTDEQANEAVMLAASQGKKKFVTFMMNQMTRLHIPLLNSSLTCILDGFSRLGQHDDVEYFFDLAIESGVTPDSQSWSAYISAVAIGSGHASALRVLERVQRLGIQVSATAYTSVLQDLVDSNKNDEAFDFWMRIKEDGVVVDVSAYEVMMQQCTQTYQVERAFNYLDEMRGSKIDPSVTIFEELFKCCGSAPHWVNGYQDTIFDAMALMEGAELLPSQKIYDNIIQSFGQAGDAASAEFYFWEMRQKGIQQGASTYKNLFGALARSQRVGASKYAVQPRYVRPPEQPKTELQRLMLKAGAVATANVLSSRFSSEGILERGKRQYAPLVSSDDEISPEEADEELLEELRLATIGQPDYHEMLLQRQRGQRALRDSETGRTIKLSLLSRENGEKLGRVHHIAPNDIQLSPTLVAPSDTIDMNDLRKNISSANVSDSLSPDVICNNKSIIHDIFDLHSTPSNNSVIDLLDSEGSNISALSHSSSGLASMLSEEVIPTEEIDRQWQAVLFGRSPDPDFSAPIKDRRRDNIIRADSLYADMMEQGVEPDSEVMSAYMSVASEGMQWEKAHQILDIFQSVHDISPDETTFMYLIRMHIFMSDIKGCLERFDEMKKRGITPNKETYGLLVATLAHRDDLVKSVQILEEAAASGVQISNRHIKKLRARFNKLGISHPNIFPDPNLWVKEVKKTRENKRNAPTGNKLQYVNSMTFV